MTVARTRRAAGIASWVLFDWAAQPFYTLVTTFVFAPYFAARVAASPAEGQALWGYATAAAGLVIAIFSPVLGAIADAAGGRKPWIAFFSALLIAGSAGLWFAVPGAEGAVAIALVAFAVGTVGAEFATVFTNATMPGLVSRERLGRLSGIGWAAGYAGGLLSLVIVLGYFAADPATGLTLLGHAPAFGLDPAAGAGDRASGPFSALWYLLFVLPLFLFMPDTPRKMPLKAAIGTGLADLGRTVRSLSAHANAARYLIANLVYTDGLVALFAFGGIYAVGVFGWSAIELGLFGILLTVTGTFGAVIGGWLDDRLGPKRVIAGSLVVLILASAAILSIDSQHIGFVFPVAAPVEGDGLFASLGERAYMAVGAAIGFVAGPLQAAGRTLMARIAPPDRMTQYFGLYALSGKVTSFAGPLAVGLLTTVSGSQRVGLAVLLAFFGLGVLLLSRVTAP